ncbi:MAG: hypothetical protein RLY14_1963 [Planctomycetota bacterium]|jgi:hypothetical protein
MRGITQVVPVNVYWLSLALLKDGANHFLNQFYAREWFLDNSIMQ